VEYIFLVTLAVYYWILWFSTRKYFPDGQVWQALRPLHSSSRNYCQKSLQTL